MENDNEALLRASCNGDEVALTSAAAFAISYGFAMLISFISGVAWDQAGDVSAAFIPILLGSLPILVAVPAFARTEETSMRVKIRQKS